MYHAEPAEGLKFNPRQEEVCQVGGGSGRGKKLFKYM